MEKTKYSAEKRIASLDPNASKNEVEKYYSDFAPNYDQEIGEMGYVVPEVSAIELINLVPKHARILDVAAGTGRVCEELIKLGYNNIDGVDGSWRMLEKARSKNIYINTMIEWISNGSQMSINDDEYDALILAGSLGSNLLDALCFRELIRVVKPGGIILVSSRSKWVRLIPKFSNGKLEEDMHVLEREGKWKLVKKVDHKENNSEQDVTVYIFEVC